MAGHPQEKRAKKEPHFFVAVLLLFILNMVITIPVLFFAAYFNAGTYYGSPSFNNGLVVLLLTLPLWLLIIRQYKKAGQRSMTLAACLNAGLSLVLFGCMALTSRG